MRAHFADALEHGDLDALRHIPKSDLHSHAGRGGHVSYIAKAKGVKIPPPPKAFASLDDMQSWYQHTIKPHCSGVEGQLLQWEAAFAQAEADHITVLALNFGTSEIAFVGGMETYTALLADYNARFAPHTTFLPELTFDRACDVDAEHALLDEIFSCNLFRSVDICHDELAAPIGRFQKIYRLAESHGLRFKAHVGEFGTANDVMEAVETLALHEIHHGIAAASSPQVMRFLADNGIRLNVCPTSNVMLGVAKDYASHPIKKLYEAGVPVTLNTDDLLIFNQTVSQEYLNLYQAGLFTATELNAIRETGLQN